MRELNLWNAERLEGILPGGRTHPLIVDCSPMLGNASTSLSERKSFVVKAIGLPEVTERGLFCEVFGNLLARELGVETPEPALIEMDNIFINATAPALASHQIVLESGLAVGCEYFKGGFTSIIPEAFYVEDEVVSASRVFGFDLLVQNPDRRPDKPNCAYLRGNLMTYDFELSFSFLLALGFGEHAWEVSKHGIAPKHLFYKYLRGAEVNWAEFASAVSRLNTAEMDHVMQSLPHQWQTWAAKVQKHLQDVAAHPQEFELELRRSLA